MVAGVADAAASFVPTLGLLQAGQRFVGTQSLRLHIDEVYWNVTVVFEHVDLAEARVCGRLRAESFPLSPLPVETWFDGEIIDNKTFTFYTGGRWSTNWTIDARSWSAFPSYTVLAGHVHPGTGRCAAGVRPTMISTDRPAVFMRWKETCFLPGSEEHGIVSINGVYYICADPLTGDIRGVYVDPRCGAPQTLRLALDYGERSGFGSQACALR